MTNLPKVIAVAIIAHDGEVISLPPPNRHHNVFHHMARTLNHPMPITGDQGFILEDGSYATREYAKLCAVANNQLLERASKLDELFSEDLY